jgi:GTP cyclohydrolase I
MKKENNRANEIVKQILECKVKDNSGLNDFQKLASNQGIFIPKVGITRFRFPVNVHYPTGDIRSHDAEASMHISLEKDKTGVNMSRLCVILQREAMNTPLNAKLCKKVLDCYQQELKDSDQDAEIVYAGLKIKFHYALKQQSLKSDNWGWQYYPITVEARQQLINGDRKFRFFITVNYEYSSTCPCSLSMAKQYERDYQAGDVSEGSGIGVAHSQRSMLQCKVEIKESSQFFIEDLLKLIRESIPTETQSLVKRVDEQAFAILNGSYPMFVEHACRMIYDNLNEHSEIIDWLASFEHFESLHSHNAAATIYKGIPGGLHHSSVF